ncbi:MAG TPA: 2-C-methyl-D-erythritol 2,4-cyclodiphosphate synthase, partial [Clostridiales bacterium]|nr:2-C-methyl-D-erythritol 2,4-cyclodiphosphate synthase [Clostridiales bacterium]
KHFPDTDDRYAGADSIVLLKAVYDLVQSKGYFISNVDATVIAQVPKLAPYIDTMKNRIASVLGVSSNRISIKATTEEKP